jgi:two-component system, sporulation sensor kinase E
MRKSGFIQKVYDKIDKLDHTKIRSIIAELSTEKDLYKLVFDSMIEGVIVTNSEGKVLLINRAMEEFISVRKGRLFSQDINDWRFDPEIMEVLDGALSSNEKILEREIHLNRTDKTFFMSVLPLLSSGEPEGHIIILVDITEKKMKEIQLRQAESLAALTTLSAGVAHEIKNPLTSIDIHIQLLQKEIAKLGKTQSRDMKNLLVIVKEEIDRLNSIVQDFLFAVRPMSMSFEREDINVIIQELADFLKYELTEKGIDLVLDLEDDLQLVMVDQKYLKQALLNIMKNSIEAIQENGEMRVKTSVSSDDDVIIQVFDNGGGISENNIGKIFEPYFTTRKFGTGLGLVIVYKIIKEFGGDIKVKSEEGKGTVFTITLPVLEKKKKLLTYEERDESQAVNR